MGQFYKDYLKAIDEVTDQAMSQIKSKFGRQFDSIKSRKSNDGGSVTGILKTDSGLDSAVSVRFVLDNIDPLVECRSVFREDSHDISAVIIGKKIIPTDKFDSKHLVDLFAMAAKEAFKHIERQGG